VEALRDSLGIGSAPQIANRRLCSRKLASFRNGVCPRFGLSVEAIRNSPEIGFVFRATKLAAISRSAPKMASFLGNRSLPAARGPQVAALLRHLCLHALGRREARRQLGSFFSKARDLAAILTRVPKIGFVFQNSNRAGDPAGPAKLASFRTEISTGWPCGDAIRTSPEVGFPQFSRGSPARSEFGFVFHAPESCLRSRRHPKIGFVFANRNRAVVRQVANAALPPVRLGILRWCGELRFKLMTVSGNRNRGRHHGRRRPNWS
jgi:hypothetical protein